MGSRLPATGPAVRAHSRFHLTPESFIRSAPVLGLCRHVGGLFPDHDSQSAACVNEILFGPPNSREHIAESIGSLEAIQATECGLNCLSAVHSG
jgi:hypothetical protein